MATYFKEADMIFRKLHDERYESADGRFVVQKSIKGGGVYAWTAWRRVEGGPTIGHLLGEHKTKRQAIEHCKREG